VTESTLTLAEFQLTDGFGRPMTVSADGVVTLPLGVWGHVKPDGTVTRANGTERGKLLPDGRLLDADDQPVATIDADGSAEVDGVVLRFDEHGKLVGEGSVPDIALKPSDSPARRTAMLVVLLSLMRPSAEDAKLVPRVQITPNLQAD
jgi:hypothetical protein